MSTSKLVGSGVVVAVTVTGSRSRRAVRWAAGNLIPHASRVVLLHVIASSDTTSPTVSPPAVPLFSSLTSYLSLNNSPRSPNEEHDDNEVREGLVQLDRKERTKRDLEPLRCLCNTDKVEIEVLDGEDVVGAIVDYMMNSGMRNLVLGCPSLLWLDRIIKGHDMPGAILNSAPPTCNVFLVCRRKLILKLASDSITVGFSPTLHVQKIKNSLLTQGRRDSQSMRSRSIPTRLTDSYQISTYNGCTDFQASNDNDLLNVSNRNPELAIIMPPISEDHNNHSQTSPNNHHPEIQRSQTHPLVFPVNNLTEGLCSTDNKFEGDSEEFERLNEEVRNTLYIFDHTCKELAFERRKVALISAECSEGEVKLRMAQEMEELARKMSEEEMARRIEAEKEVEAAKHIFAKEALERHIAEVNALKESIEKQKLMEALFADDRVCRSYSSLDIEVATNNFSESMKIGEGGYGNVYKCYLEYTPVAIKVLKKNTMENKEQFLREVEVLTQIRHPHVVTLLGVCAESGCLVYEYMENGSLDDRLSCKDGTEPLPWATRFQILYDVACTLAFLHGSKPEPIIHCDLKPGNILLDHTFVSKIGDVGLARLLSYIAPDDLTEYRDTVITGTANYMDPEYQRTGTLRPKSDLYALGIIILQVLTAKPPLGLTVLVENALKDNNLDAILDKSVQGWPIDECKRLANIALRCTALRCRDRPDLDSEVIPEMEQMLDSIDTRLQKVQDNCMPSQYYCPILRQVMDDPYIACDGFTYERRAIEAWLARHHVSPMTQLELPDTCILPNLTMRSAIQEWRSKMELSAS